MEHLYLLLHQVEPEPVGHMYYRFSNPTLFTNLASYALGRGPQYMVLYMLYPNALERGPQHTKLLHYCIIVHYIVL